MMKSNPERTDIGKTLLELSALTWNRIADGEQYGVRQSEETITETLLLHLVKAHSDQVRVSMFSRRAEGRSGADWDWWFVSEKHWFPMRVQAKRLHPDSKKRGNHAYDTLPHTVGKTGIRQVDILIWSATEKNKYPLYCFYNYWPNNHQDDDVMRAAQNRVKGWEVADARLVRQLINEGRVKRSDIELISSPITTIFSDPLTKESKDEPLPFRAHRAVKQLVEKGSGDTALVPEVRDRVPRFAYDLFRGYTVLDDDLLPDTQGVVVFRGLDYEEK